MEKKAELRVVNDGNSAGRGIDRREMVRRLLAGAGAGFVLPGVAGAHPIHKHLTDVVTMLEADAKTAASEWTPEFLEPHQNQTLIVLAERIVPGSTRAQANRFIDLLLSVDTRENQQAFINSLSAIDAASLAHFGQPFSALSEARQNELLAAASNQQTDQPQGEGDWSWFAVPPKRTSDQHHLTLRHHFDNLKGWISGAYYSSEVGMRELGWTGNVFFESFPGCDHPGGHH